MRPWWGSFLRSRRLRHGYRRGGRRRWIRRGRCGMNRSYFTGQRSAPHIMKTVSMLLLVGAAFCAETGDVSGERMRADVKYLASDKLEGRGVGTPGEKL